jgi:hypothetical protein
MLALRSVSGEIFTEKPSGIQTETESKYSLFSRNFIRNLRILHGPPPMKAVNAMY